MHSESKVLRTLEIPSCVIWVMISIAGDTLGNRSFLILVRPRFTQLRAPMETGSDVSPDFLNERLSSIRFRGICRCWMVRAGAPNSRSEPNPINLKDPFVGTSHPTPRVVAMYRLPQ